MQNKFLLSLAFERNEEKDQRWRGGKERERKKIQKTTRLDKKKDYLPQGENRRRKKNANLFFAIRHRNR